MRDDDPPKCPGCGRKLKPRGAETRPGRKLCDADYYLAKIWGCAACKLRYRDALDGSELSIEGTTKGKR